MNKYLILPLHKIILSEFSAQTLKDPVVYSNERDGSLNIISDSVLGKEREGQFGWSLVRRCTGRGKWMGPFQLEVKFRSVVSKRVGVQVRW